MFIFIFGALMSSVIFLTVLFVDTKNDLDSAWYFLLAFLICYLFRTQPPIAALLKILRREKDKDDDG